VFFIERGVVEILVIEGGDDALCIPSTTVTGDGGGGGSDGGEDADAPPELPMERINKVSSGGIFGTDAFLLNLPHRCRALAIADTLVWSIARSDLARMEVTHPKVSRKHAIACYWPYFNLTLTLPHTHTPIPTHTQITHTPRARARGSHHRPQLCIIIQQVLLKSMALLSDATLYNHPGAIDSEYHPIYQQ
jgi:hypothetical protein